MMGKWMLGCLFLAVMAVQSVWANDTSSGDVNGTLVFQQQPNISMEKEVLFISEQAVDVEYNFLNTAKQAINTQVTFPMPPIYIGLSDHNTLEDFKLWVNDKPQSVSQALVVKMADGVDISRQFAQFNWTPAEVKAFAEDQVAPVKKPPLPKDWFDQDGMPRFTMSHYYSWQQNFPAGQVTKVRHSYKPSVDTGVPMPAEFIVKDMAKHACIDAATQAGIKKRESAVGINWAYLRYILLTANNWQGPIKSFELTIQKQHPQQIISLCFDGELKKIDPLRFRFSAKDFSPRQDLNILFLAKPL